MSQIPQAPDYDGGSLTSVLPSAAAALGVPGYWDLLGFGDRYRHVIVVLIDGLGLSALTAHGEQAAFLNSANVTGLSAAVPTTTPTGLGSLGTGSAPGTHGLVGASFMVEGHHGVVHPLQWQDAPIPRAVQPHPTMLENLTRRGVTVTSIGPRAYEKSGLTEAALRGGTYRGADGVGERLGELIPVSAGRGPALTYMYWPDLDRTGHGHGVDSDHWRNELEHVDYLVERIAGLCSADDLLVVTADHGMVDVDPSHRIDIDDIPQLRHHVLAIAGEPRCRFVYTRSGHAQEVAEIWQEALGEFAWITTRDDAIDAGYFGRVDPIVLDRIGDVIAWAKDTWSLASDQTDARVSGLRGQHGSLTDTETQIPLVTVVGEHDRG